MPMSLSNKPQTFAWNQTDKSGICCRSREKRNRPGNETLKICRRTSKDTQRLICRGCHLPFRWEGSILTFADFFFAAIMEGTGCSVRNTGR
ncbi:hypothetical protein D3C73_601570 [compost metagenome]